MENFIPFILYVVTTVYTPGPNTIMSMVNARQFGFKNSLPFYMGIFTAFIVVMFGCGYFNLFLFNIMPKIEKLIRIFGALYMLYLAYKVAFGKNKGLSTLGNGTNTYLSGLSMQFLNPKVIILGITVMGTFIIPYYKSAVALIIFSLLLSLIALSANLCWGLFGSLLQGFIKKYDKQFNMVMGILLVYCAASILGIV